MRDGAATEDLGEEVLIPVVRRALDDETATLRQWRIDALDYHNFSDQRTLYRASGTATVRGRLRRWSAVLKQFRLVPDGTDPVDDPRHYTFWKREALLYASPLFDNLPPGFAAPRYLGGDEGPSRVRVWLEDLFETQPRWPLRRYVDAARALGAFNGGYIAAAELADIPWLADQSSVLSYYGSTNPRLQPAIDFLAQAERWADPRIVATLGMPLDLGAVGDMYAEEARWIERLEALPQALGHNDAFRDNLYARRSGGRPETVAFDWQLCGLSALGSELASFVAASIIFFGFPPRRADELERAAIDAYLRGLRDVGIVPDEDELRLAYRAAAVLRLGMVTAAWLSSSLDEPDFVADFWHHPAGEVMTTFAQVARLLEIHAREAREMVGAG